MIDAHLHVVAPNVPGAGSLNPVLDAPAEAVAEALRVQMQAAGITQALAVGRLGGADGDPLGVAGTQAVARHLPGLFALGALDPSRTSPEDLRAAEAALSCGAVKGLFVYLGYHPEGPSHPGYRPYYEQAERFRVPVVFHTGDPYSTRARLSLTRPLLIDDLAVVYPRVNFVLAGLGHPWVMDAAAVVAKNINVWADLAGLATGDETSFSAPERQEMLQDVVSSVRRAFRYAERPNRFLFGSDWPLTALAPYAALMARAVPEIYHPQVFEDNARVLFRLR
jgi:predicted TIM-barrel fold metal-dependent hydrolase